MVGPIPGSHVYSRGVGGFVVVVVVVVVENLLLPLLDYGNFPYSGAF